MRLPRRPKSTLPFIARFTSSKAFKTLLWPLEKLTYGKSVHSDGTVPVVADKLTPELLGDLFAAKILAIHIPNYVEREACDHIATGIIGENLSNWNVYDLKDEYKASDVNVLGNPFNMACRSEETWRGYFEAAKLIPKKFRQLASPYSFPLDTFQELITETWNHGMIVETYRGHQMTPGLARVMYDKDIINPDAPLGCHVDSPPILSDKKGLFSVNIYLQQPKSGGDLYIWNPEITSFLDILKNWNLVKNFFLESNYLTETIQLNFQKLLPPPTKLQIGQGDLVLLHTGRPHAVVPFSGGPRVSLQAFLNYKKSKPVAAWA